MATREEIQRKLVDLDMQINSEVDANRLPKIEYRPFPKWDWIAAVVLLGFYYGQASILALIPVKIELPDMAQTVAFWFGWALVVLAIVRTVLWTLQRRAGAPAGYMESMKRVRDLQAQRKELQNQMRTVDK